MAAFFSSNKREYYRKGELHCNYYNYGRHTKNTCYNLHGYPTWHSHKINKGKKKECTTNQGIGANFQQKWLCLLNKIPITMGKQVLHMQLPLWKEYYEDSPHHFMFIRILHVIIKLFLFVCYFFNKIVC